MDQPRATALSELRELGLTVDIDEKVASRIWANLLIVDGRFEQGKSGHYTKMAQATEYLQAIYHAIAKCLVDENTADDVIEQTIPDIAVAFFSKTGGRFFTLRSKTEMDRQKEAMEGPINEWKGKAILKRLRHEPSEDYEPATDGSNETLRRRKLLETYKEFTGATNRQIYQGRSGIHKPEFYAWLKGKLKGTSETAQNFERFLREKKSPIPRKLKN